MIFVLQVVRVWKDDDVNLEKAFKATVSKDTFHKVWIWWMVAALELVTFQSTEACCLNLQCGFESQLFQGSRLILTTGRSIATKFLSWSQKHVIW